jgi:hypothetical protein
MGVKLVAAEAFTPRSPLGTNSAYRADRKTFPIDTRSLASQRLRNHCSITTISLMPTHMSKAEADGFRIPAIAIWDSAEALARADWMHEQIKAELAAYASAGKVGAR